VIEMAWQYAYYSSQHIAEVISPGGFDYGPMGYGDSRLGAQKSAMQFVRNTRAIADRTYRSKG
jgi:hypothetical protein